MLTMEEIKKALDSGKEVELECINEAGFISLYKCNGENNKIILNQGVLAVERVCSSEEFVYLKGVISPSISNVISFEELKYFRIKRPAPCLIELIKLVEDAKNKKLIGSFCAINSDWQQEIMVIIKETTYKWDFNNQGIKGAYDLIDSLYTETFVIDDSYFPELKAGGKFTQNGIEWELDEERIESIVKTPLFILKGATVTQKRGAQC